MRLSLLTIPVPVFASAKAGVPPTLVIGATSLGGFAIPEPALLAALGVALLGISKLLRK